jgi:hypothetical protein
MHLKYILNVIDVPFRGETSSAYLLCLILVIGGQDMTPVEIQSYLRLNYSLKQFDVHASSSEATSKMVEILV